MLGSSYLFTIEVARILLLRSSAAMKLLQLFSHFGLAFLYKNFDSLFHTILGKDGLFCDDVGWCSGFNKGGDGIDGVDIVLGNIMEGMGNNKQVDPTHVVPIGSSIIVVYGGKIMYAISFSLIR